MFEKQTWMQRAGEYPQSDQEYFGLLARAVFSAGLGPKVVESRWNDITGAFHSFDPAKVKDMDQADVEPPAVGQGGHPQPPQDRGGHKQRGHLLGARRGLSVVSRVSRSTGRRRRPGRRL